MRISVNEQVVGGGLVPCRGLSNRLRRVRFPSPPAPAQPGGVMASDLMAPDVAISSCLYYNKPRQTPAGTTNVGGVFFCRKTALERLSI